MTRHENQTRRRNSASVEIAARQNRPTPMRPLGPCGDDRVQSTDAQHENRALQRRYGVRRADLNPILIVGDVMAEDEDERQQKKRRADTNGIPSPNR